MLKITTREWNRIPKDYKNINKDGQKYILQGTILGTCSVPVEIDDKNGCEWYKYTFTEFGIAYDVYAYSEEEARNALKLSGHCISEVKDLHLAANKES